jgi:hypothetical protein
MTSVIIGWLSLRSRILSALVIALLAISCSPDQPAEPQVSAQRPVDKISTNFELQSHCSPSALGCGSGVFPSSHPVSFTQRRSHRRETEALVRQLRQGKPSWLRYVKAVEISTWVRSPLAPDPKSQTPSGPEFFPQNGAEGSRELLVQTGIWLNEPGKDVGAEICRALLQEKLDTVSIYGVSGEWQVPLAQCH